VLRARRRGAMDARVLVRDAHGGAPVQVLPSEACTTAQASPRAAHVVRHRRAHTGQPARCASTTGTR
jgi:hypothetical protein